MSIFRVTPNASHIQSAYDRALVFDRMKKKADEEGAEAKAQTGIDTATLTEADSTTTYTYTAKEKQKPNTVPFKTGFVFEYGSPEKGGTVSISITDAERINVQMDKDALTDDRKKSIRALVMLGLKKLDRTEFNGMLEEGRQSPEIVRKELSLMGINDKIPFGLGEDSYYFDHAEKIRPYNPIDVKG
ncbi:MAG: hypothetical protein JNL74_16075 [Fibrobacteres bacterium]|nr:hypothetical protein [Fibrobacterota bacterium]